ncbi:HU family DNA-binding protein [Prevotella sp.]|uniref:HU family DNA-binding protein n=1 Tax=Prevotella sp. TaxID=59823 RepID=UPI0025CFEB3C|nr:hypothetical protein [Prevotella sp.]
MAIKTRIAVRVNHLTQEKLASAQIVDLQQMSFPEFCDYMAQDSTVGAADVMAVMTQLEKKLPLLLALGTKVQVSAEGMTVRPTVSGSLTQSQLKAKLEARKAAGEDVDVNRDITAADLTTKDLTAGVAIDFSKKFNAAFARLVQASGRCCCNGCSRSSRHRRLRHHGWRRAEAWWQPSRD